MMAVILSPESACCPPVAKLRVMMMMALWEIGNPPPTPITTDSGEMSSCAPGEQQHADEDQADRQKLGEID